MLLYPNRQYLSYSENMLNKCQLRDMWQTKMACHRRNAGVASYDGLCLYKGYQFNNKDGSCSCILSVALRDSCPKVVTFISTALYTILM